MKINDAYPSKYLRASDLDHKQQLVRIARIGTEVIGDDSKLILYFQGRDQGMVLNRTNANNIAAIYGDETDNWIGNEIVLFEAMVDFQGKSVPAIRVRAPRKPSQQNSAPARQQAKAPPDDMGDQEIPF